MGVSAKSASAVQTIDPYALFESRPTFSHVATSTGPARIIITSGQVGADVNGVVPASIDAQIALAFENLSRCLEAAGAVVTDVIKLTYYVVNYDPTKRHYKTHLLNFLNGHRPATTLVPVSKLAIPEYLFEIEATAAVAQATTQSVDVVVVGGGLSGLQAAYDLQRAGISCVVVEARDRVGGKTLSVQPDSIQKIVDLGAAWINDTNQSKVYALAQKLGLDFVIQNTTGHVVQEDLDGSKSTFNYGSTPEVCCSTALINFQKSNAKTQLVEINGVENMVYIRDLVDEVGKNLDVYKMTSTGHDLDQTTFEEFVTSKGKGNSALAAATVWTRAMLGEFVTPISSQTGLIKTGLEPREMSAFFFIDYCMRGGGLAQMRSDQKHGGQYMRLPHGIV